MIRIVSDSSTLYSIEEANKNNIDIAPLTVTINNKSYKE
ncbi:MAG: DegV family protein, partial [Turicibacter sp.]